MRLLIKQGPAGALAILALITALVITATALWLGAAMLARLLLG